jgi:hypothetical protein
LSDTDTQSHGACRRNRKNGTRKKQQSKIFHGPVPKGFHKLRREAKRDLKLSTNNTDDAKLDCAQGEAMVRSMFVEGLLRSVGPRMSLDN